MKSISSRLLAIFLAVISVFATAVPAMAAGSQNSVGSKASDIVAIDDSSYTVTGKDSTQNKQSQFDVYTYNGNDIISSVNVYGTIADGSNIYDPSDPDADDDGFVNGEIQVGVPTTIIFSGTANANGEYVGISSGKVKGNISGATVINVVPDESFTLSSEGKKDITATVNQDYTKFVVETSEVSGAKVNKHVTPKFNDKAVFTVTVKTTEATAGSWQGNFNYNISLTNSASEAIGTRVTSWNISATENDDVWMTYYQPESKALSAPKTSSGTLNATSVEKYENGTVVIRGTGNMEEYVNKHFYNLKKLNEDATANYWADLKDKLTEDEYAALTAQVDEGTMLYEYISANSIAYTDALNSLSSEIRKLTEKGNYRLNPNAKNNYLIYSPSNVIIEEGVTNVSKGAFSACDKIESVLLPETITEIASAAFSNCNHISSINIPDSVTKIGAFAFNGCTALKEITLGENVTVIEQMAFDNMTATIYCANETIADMIINTNTSSNPAKPTIKVN